MKKSLRNWLLKNWRRIEYLLVIVAIAIIVAWGLGFFSRSVS